MNKKSISLAVVLALGVSGCATAGRYDNNYRYLDDAEDSYLDEARVIKAKPIYETVSVNNPETRCWNERVRHHRAGSSGNSSYTPTIAGAILGGVVGNQFGGGKGKDAMTVAGMLLGGSIGNDMREQPRRAHSYTTTEKRCETVNNYEERNELVGYNVKYKYNGKNYWTRMSHDPGEYIKVNVSVDPVEF